MELTCHPHSHFFIPAPSLQPLPPFDRCRWCSWIHCRVRPLEHVQSRALGTPKVPSLTEGTFRGTHLTAKGTHRWTLQNLKQLAESSLVQSGCPSPKKPHMKNPKIPPDPVWLLLLRPSRTSVWTAPSKSTAKISIPRFRENTRTHELLEGERERKGMRVACCLARETSATLRMARMPHMVPSPAARSLRRLRLPPLPVWLDQAVQPRYTKRPPPTTAPPRRHRPPAAATGAVPGRPPPPPSPSMAGPRPGACSRWPWGGGGGVPLHHLSLSPRSSTPLPPSATSTAGCSTAALHAMLPLLPHTRWSSR